MTRAMLFMLLLLASSCSPMRRMRKEARQAASTESVLLFRADSAAASATERQAREISGQLRAAERSTAWQLREEYSAPDSAGRQWRTARTLTRTDRTKAAAGKVAAADTVSRSAGSEARAHEYRYGNHWAETASRQEEWRRESPRRWPYVLLGAAGAAGVCIAFKRYLKRKKA